MNIGNIVEYIDQQKIICAVVLQIKKQRLRLLTEFNREVNISVGRLSHLSGESLDMTASRDALVRNLKQCALSRQELSKDINIQELWELLHEDEEPIDLETMTSFCFDPPVTPDHETAVVRAFFNDKLYFKFSKDIFFPNTPDQIDNKLNQLREAERKEKLVEQGALWLNTIDKGSFSDSEPSPSPPDPEIVTILKDYYIYDKDSRAAADARAIMSRGGIDSPHQVFNLLVKSGIWNEHENLDIIRMDIPVDFPESVHKNTAGLIANHDDFLNDPKRMDLQDIPLITIDGQSTLDYDDAISLQKEDDGYILGIHIIDVGFFIKNDDPVDRHARLRGSSIYMPDDKIPMLPPDLSEDLCSLVEEKIRPGISTIVRLNRFFEIIDYDIVPSIIKVHHQMTYTEANILNGEDDPITTLYRIATVLREKRIKAGAVQITLPEVNLWIEENGDIGISKIDRENPSRMLISELMILANSLMAEFLSKHNVPAVFRSQPDPKQRLFQGVETSLFLNCMQRRQLNRAIIGTSPEHHSGLGVDAYVTATSPIRRYYDLLTQRQIRGILGYEPAYSKDELQHILHTIETAVGNTGRVQYQRRRYWLLKYLEGMKGSKEDALVLDARRDNFTVLLKEYMLEWRIPSSNINAKPGDIIQVTIQHADARRDQLSLLL
ncbi:putative ribonuclease II (RNB family protein) [Desulfamplus magnetovallimortis]|uniref:Putative ribonuclease II (RNB family protein) n=1 Tax=Desulfamplus magnetovallimortis TaxID=1246637 RepID=A0A1W1H610_9BACT|nr:RNB domain-containing ribonuclease [Desulfamplus magnetovallimortis]SLM27921.1 putative ribonuclease II (RNB family protein) [Desulfamplus magnetovallimortis]